MIVTLTDEVETQILRLVDSGQFPSADAVIAEAIGLLESHQRQLNALQEKLQIGIDEADRGELDEWTPELRARIRRDADERYRRGELPHPDVTP